MFQDLKDLKSEVQTIGKKCRNRGDLFNTAKRFGWSKLKTGFQSSVVFKDGWALKVSDSQIVEPPKTSLISPYFLNYSLLEKIGNVWVGLQEEIIIATMPIKSYLPEFVEKVEKSLDEYGSLHYNTLKIGARPDLSPSNWGVSIEAKIKIIDF